jgi:hypothetical protein
MNKETKGFIAVLVILIAVSLLKPFFKTKPKTPTIEMISTSYVPTEQERTILRLEQANWKMGAQLDSIEKTKPHVVAVMKDGDINLVKIHWYVMANK